jgi:adenylosuccinate lyase
MEAAARGGDRQTLHERIRQHSLAVTAELKAGRGRNDLLDQLRADPAFAGVPFAEVLDPTRFIGRAAQQVEEFLAEEIQPVRQRYAHLLNQTADVQV